MARFKTVRDPELDARRKRGRPRNQEGRKTKTNPSRCSAQRVAGLWVAIVDQEQGAKMREVERMGFGNVKHIPNWKANQPLLVALASSYDRNSKSLVLGTRKILITVELIARCLGFPNHGQSYKATDSPEDRQLFKSLKNKTVAELTTDVIHCTLKNEADKLYFRRHFLLLVLKCFFLATTRAIVSECHINAVIHVEDPRKIYWARYIYDHLIEGVLRFQDGGTTTVDGCLYALLIIYLHANLHGDLENYKGSEPWIADWSAAQLDVKASEEITRPFGLLNRAASRDAPSCSVSSSRRKQVLKKGTVEDNTVTKKMISKDMPTKGNTNEYSSGKSKVRVIGDTSGGHVESTGSTPGRHRHIPSPSGPKKKTRPVEDINFETTARSEQVQELPTRETLNGNVDIGSSAKSYTKIGFVPVCRTPEAIPAPSYSLGLTQMEVPITPPATPITDKRGANDESIESADEYMGATDVASPSDNKKMVVKPTGAEMERIYRWATEYRGKNNATIASITSGDHIQISRCDLWSMGSRKQVCSTVVDYCCAMFNASRRKRFRTKFYCFNSMIMTLMLTERNINACKGPMNGFFPVISEKLREGKNWYNVEKARDREYWFFPVCKNDHWWLYVLHRKTENLWVLDSIHEEPDTEYRQSIDKYVGVLLKELAAYVDDTGPFNGDGYDCGYEQVNGKQPNTWDCGVYVLKWMQKWDPKSLGDEAPPLPEWDNDELRQFRKELVMDMLYCAENVSKDSLPEGAKLSQRRVEDRGKRIHLKDPWTNPRTKSLLRKAERAPKGKHINKV